MQPVPVEHFAPVPARFAPPPVASLAGPHAAMLDPALRRLVEAPDDASADRALAALLDGRATPLIRRVAARKLRRFRDGAGSFSDDLHDITSDVLLALVSRLRSLREEPRRRPIACFDDYTAAVTFNAFARYVRDSRPQRSRLKDRLRYVLTRHRRFSLWPAGDGLACGLADWRPRSPSAQAAARLERLRDDAGRWQRWARGEVAAQGAIPLLRAGFEAAGGPVEFDRLVDAVAAASGTAEAVREPGSGALASLPDRTAEPAELHLDRRRVLAELWRDIGGLAARQRVALLLNLRDDSGGGLLWVFAAAGTATPEQIGGALEMPAFELAALWGDLPLPDQAIADRLGCTRQQVINLRASARKRLARRRSRPTVCAAPSGERETLSAPRNPSSRAAGRS